MSSPVPTPRNVVMIQTDQQRFDTIGALNAPHMLTPNLDRLVGEGVAYDDRLYVENFPEMDNTGDDYANYLKAETLDWLMVSRYLGSLPQCDQVNGQRTIWPPNHPHDPYVLHGGSIGRLD